jgi:hypothetical protein
MEKRQIIKRAAILGVVISWLLVPIYAWSASIDDVIFLNRVQEYETIVDTTLVTQEGKRIPLPKGTKLNVAGFTRDEAFIISRSDRPNGFLAKMDIAPRSGSPRVPDETIREETVK